ncbi:protealysin inhibitor emfourin [Streptomyces sp. NPDC007369]|uniref:protealysin inhibitor emfourin n=1 Tax=Streptomyces sp. NPDC007369 TaxID=3154589 RepID=UPI0033E42BBF
MKVTLTERGGLAATINLAVPPEVLDTDDLPDDAAAELARLVAAATPTPTVDQPGRARDAMSYTITVDDGGRSTVLKQSDAAMSPAFAALLAWLRNHFAQQ